MEKQNRFAAPTAQLSAIVVNFLSPKQSQPVDISSFLPFPPKPIVLSDAESEAVLDRFFNAYVKRAEAGREQ